MKRRYVWRQLPAHAVLLLAAYVPLLSGQVNIVTYHYDNQRTGQNTQETVLNPVNVQPARFGRLFSQVVDGQVYAQPLYLPNQSIPSLGTHNVVFVATENDSVYAFDADGNSGANALPLWHTSLGTPADASSGVTDCNLASPYGVTSTPVIDPHTGTIYVVANLVESGNVVYRLYALSVATGQERSAPFGSTIISGMVDGIQFAAPSQLNRPGLLFSNGTVYVAFGSHCDGKARGWVFAYDAATLSQTGTYITTTAGLDSPMCSASFTGRATLGTVWMSGAGLAADTNGNLFFATGNGYFDGVTNFGDSILKLSGNLSLVDYFTPFNQCIQLDHNDWDLGSGGVLLLPDQPGNHPHLLVQAGKEGTIYLVDRDQMGGYCSGCSSDSNIPQELVETLGGSPGDAMWGMPAYWNNTVYFWAADDVLKAFPLSGGVMGTAPVRSLSSYAYPGANLSVSADGGTNGIVWSLRTGPLDQNTQQPTGRAILQAHQAVNVSNLLYSSDVNSLRDNWGSLAVKFSVPVVANGKVYVGTANQLSVYGLNPHSAVPWVPVDRLFW